MQLGLGTAWLGKIPFAQRRKTILELLDLCRDSGVDYVDTARSYFWGFAEQLVATGVSKTVGWKPTVTTKIGLKLFQRLANGDTTTTNNSGFAPPQQRAVRTALRRELERSMRNLAGSKVSSVLLHCPPTIVSSQSDTWQHFRQLTEPFGVQKVGLSVDRNLSPEELPQEAMVSVVQVSARQFVLNNKLFAESPSLRAAQVVVHRIIDLNDDFNEGLTQLSALDRAPDVALVGTTKPERLRHVIQHWRNLDGIATND